MVCLGLEPGAAWWKAQMNPLSYGSTPKKEPTLETENAPWIKPLRSDDEAPDCCCSCFASLSLSPSIPSFLLSFFLSSFFLSFFLLSFLLTWLHSFRIHNLACFAFLNKGKSERAKLAHGKLETRSKTEQNRTSSRLKKLYRVGMCVPWTSGQPYKFSIYDNNTSSVELTGSLPRVRLKRCNLWL